MERADVDAVAALESAIFSTPWSPPTFEALVSRPGVDTWVCTGPDDDVVGYAILWRVMDEAELANIAVAREHRRRGVGARLLDHVIDRARREQVKKIFLEVRESNAAAAALYRQRGFEDVGRRKDYYDSPREDARLLRLELDDPSGDD